MVVVLLVLKSIFIIIFGIKWILTTNCLVQHQLIHLFTPETPHSIYKIPESSDDCSDETTPSGASRDKLNNLLSSRDISPIRSKLNTAWHLTKERTKRHYTWKVRQAVHAVIEEIAPGEGGLSVIKGYSTSVST